MTQLNEIRIMNDTMILYLKKMGIDYQRNELIKKILADDACFFKLNKEDAFLILDSVGIKNNVEEIYTKLISSDVYYDLCEKGKINENDSELVIKYQMYDVKNLFKNDNASQRNDENANKNAALTKSNENGFFQKLFDRLKSFFTLK